MKEFMSLNNGMIGVPFTFIVTQTGDQIKISGYNKKAFKEALGI